MHEYSRLPGPVGKSKDTPKAWEDQEHHKGRDGMHPGQFQGRASYALTKEEKEIFFEVLFSIKVPTGFSSKIKGIVNMKDKKFYRKCSPGNCEGMCIPQCNFLEGNRSRKSIRVTD
jgi:hypothetical protein